MAIETPKKKKEGWLDTVKIIVEALLIAIVIRTLLFQPFNIPSSSMEPNLLVGDYLFISKYSYGYSRYSIPFNPPVVSGRVWASEPKRGDVIVFKLPRNTSIDYVKRLIGMPGDRIKVANGVLHINNQPVKREMIEERVEQERIASEGRTIAFKVAYYKETNPEGVSYTVREALGDKGPNDNTYEYVVPEGHYFMMGDNRDLSEDSRSSDVGFVPFENLEGRAEILFFSVKPGYSGLAFWNWPSSIRWQRLFQPIK